MKRLVGERLGNFTLARLVGQGTMGGVFLARHDRLDRPKAVKVLRPEWSRDAEQVRRFFAEARAAAACSSEHIVAVDDCGTLAAGDGTAYHYILMEWIEGRDLESECARGERMPLPRAVHIVSQAAVALEAAHAAGIVHRDIKPANIFLSLRGDDPDFVTLLDFGIARLTGRLAAGRKTRTGEVIGTPAYMSPEQARGLHPDARSDVFSLGVVLYQLLAGALPFMASSFARLAAKILRHEPPSLGMLRPDLPVAVVEVVRQAMAKRPERRFPSMRAFREALLGAVGEPTIVDGPGADATPTDEERSPVGPVATPPAARTPRRLDLLPGEIPTGPGRASSTPTLPRRERRSLAPWLLVGGGLALTAGAVALLLLR